MAEGVLIGLDVGTSTVKAGAFDARSGAALAEASRTVPIDVRADGGMEVQAEDLASAVRRTVRALRRELGGRWSAVAGIGLASQGGSGCLFDRRDATPRTPMQLWNDPRPRDRLPEIAGRRPPSFWQSLGCGGDPGAGLARLTWLRDHFPGAWDEQAIYGGAGEYLYFQLTGVWRQDAGNAVQIGCYDAHRRTLTDTPLALVDATLDRVAPLREGHTTHPLSEPGAKWLGCRHGVATAGPYMDHEAGFLAASASTRGRVLQASLGTAWVGNFLHPNTTPPTGALNLVLPAPVDDGSLVVRVLPAGNATIDWANRLFTGQRGAAAQRRRLDRVLSERLLPPAGLVGLPWLTWPNPFAEAGGGGGVLGVNAHTRRDDLLRAAVAGLCFAFRDTLDQVLASVELDTVLLTGGASRIPGVRTLLAALLHPLPMRWATTDSLAGAGGSVWRFNRRAGRGEIRRIPAPGAARLRDVGHACEQFCQTCQRLAEGWSETGPPLRHYARSRSE